MSYNVRVGRREFYGMRGNLHMHTVLSDGTKPHHELAHIASEAGLDFIIVTDHNTYEPGLDAWVGGTLLLVGEEVHDPHREPQSSHVLCFDISGDVAQHAADPQGLIDAVTEQGGFAFLAHPFERDVADFLPEPNISWRDWHVTGYAGIELWNYMSEFKSTLRSKAHALLCAFAPRLAISGPYPETLRKWDHLLRAGPVAALGGSDAHGTVYHMGPISRAVQPYHILFRSVNTHLLAEQGLTGDVVHDKSVVYGALRSGRGFLGNEQLGSIDGFSFWARSNDAEATMGERLDLRNAVELRIATPTTAWLRLLRDGQVIAESRGDSLALMTPQPGVYRAEAYRRSAGKRRGWIFSNPIYVR
jgi:hypothetical protein